MRNFLIALQFLSVFPIKINELISDKDFGKSLAYFPLVGLLLGGLLALASFAFSSLPQLVIGALILVILVIITGAIHLDGFADACDGFYASSSKEKILEVMRDSRIGSMGVVGLSCLLIFKFALISSIPLDHLWKTLIMMVVFSRWSQALSCLVSDYARKEGKAKHFIESVGLREVFIGGIFSLGLFFILVQIRGVVLFLSALTLVLLIINWIKVKIEGMTGDTIGAVNEIAEVIILLLSLFLIK